MASKNITMALFLTINLVFFGFTMGQAPGPQALICPRSSNQVRDCTNRLTSVVGGLNVLPLTQCCNLVAGLPTPLAAACMCSALNLSVLEIVRITVNLGQVLRSCGVPALPGFTCA